MLDLRTYFSLPCKLIAEEHNLETYILQQSGVIAEVHRRLRADEWDEPLDDVREFVHEHHDLMKLLADHDKESPLPYGLEFN